MYDIHTYDYIFLRYTICPDPNVPTDPIMFKHHDTFPIDSFWFYMRPDSAEKEYFSAGNTVRHRKGRLQLNSVNGSCFFNSVTELLRVFLGILTNQVTEFKPFTEFNWRRPFLDNICS